VKTIATIEMNVTYISSN